MTLFYNTENDQELNPMDIIGKNVFALLLLKLNLSLLEEVMEVIKYFFI